MTNLHYLLAAINQIGTPEELGLPKVGLNEGVVAITNLVFLGVAAAAILWLVLFGAIPYVFSGGEPAATKKSKDVIVYAVIGIVVSLLAFAIVNFVTSRVH